METSANLQGSVKTIGLPSGRLISIRETNGDDEATLSNLSTAKDNGANLTAFMASIMVNDSTKPEGHIHVASDILDWKTADLYYALFRQRVLEQGADFSFEYECQNPDCKKTSTYEEDLNLIGLESDPSYKVIEGSNLVRVYKNGGNKFVEWNNTKKDLRFQNLTVLLDNASKNISESSTDAHTPIRERRLEWYQNNEWKLVTSFKDFTRLEMADIRKMISTHDEQFLPVSKFSCPHCQTNHKVNIMLLPGFYYPEKMM